MSTVGKSKQTSLTVRIDQEQMDWLDEVSIKDRRTRSELVRMILDFCISNIKDPRELIEDNR